MHSCTAALSLHALPHFLYASVAITLCFPRARRRPRLSQRILCRNRLPPSPRIKRNKKPRARPKRRAVDRGPRTRWRRAAATRGGGGGGAGPGKPARRQVESPLSYTWRFRTFSGCALRSRACIIMRPTNTCRSGGRELNANPIQFRLNSIQTHCKLNSIHTQFESHSI